MTWLQPDGVYSRKLLLYDPCLQLVVVHQMDKPNASANEICLFLNLLESMQHDVQFPNLKLCNLVEFQLESERI